LAAFGAVIRGLQEAPPGPARIRALGSNHDLWSALVKDMAAASNRLPEALKTELIQLGAWSMRYSTLAILNGLPVEPLIAVNRNIADGIAQQKQPLAGSATTNQISSAAV
jgi:flagellar biosynthesis activator protein FlaF